MIFFIKYKNIDSKKYSYTIMKFFNLEQAISFFLKEKNIILKIKKLPNIFEIFLNFFQSKLKEIELIEFLKNVGMLLNSGMSIVEIIEDLKEESNNKNMNKLLNEMKNSLDNGETLSDSFEKFNWIPEIVINIVRMGENSGNVAISFKKSSEYLNKIYTLKKNAKKALIYPSVAFTTLIIGFFFWLFYVLPKMIDFFVTLNIKVPAITQFLYDSSQWLLHNYIVLLVFNAMIVFSIYILIKRPKILAKYIDKIILNLPIIGNIIQKYNTAFISEYLSIAIGSGFGIFDTLKILKINIKNKIYSNAINEILKDVLDGNTLYSSLDNSNVFPKYMIRMMRSGENSGTVDTQMEYVSKRYYTEVEETSNNIQKTIQPVIIFVIALFIIFILTSFIAPLYDSFTTILK